MHFIVALAFGIASVLGANAQAPAPTGTVHGHVADQTGALIPGAKITVTTANGKEVGKATADSSGTFEVHGLAADSYIVSVTFDGFAPFVSKPLALAAGQSKRVDVAMAIEVEQQNVVVSEDSPGVSVDPGSNANSIVIKGKDLDALSDDPDELSNELSALAGPSAGPNGGQIYIDGFTGGQLPPKSAIREIRINQNPFSAEFDRLGYGRIEILTKPGTDKLHGSMFVQGNDNVFNTGNPFNKDVPPYYRIQYNMTLNGSLNKKTSFFVNFEQRDNHDEQVYVYRPAIFDSATNTYSLSDANVSGSQANPHNRIGASGRIDYQLSAKDTLTARYQFYYDSESGDIGSQDLPSQSTKNSSKEHTIQLSDSHVINDHMVNETRLEYQRDTSTQTPVSLDPTLSISGDFTGGGASGQTQNSHSDHLELQNITTMSAGRHAIKFGTWLRDNRTATSSFSNRNGSLVFQQYAYVNALNTLAAGHNINTIGTNTTGCNDTTCSGLTNLSITAGKTDYSANVFDAALFFQDDWKVSPRMTFSAGVRWESQNHSADHNDWSPRVAIAYALDAKGNKPAKTVWRAGYGFFYDRLGVGNVLSATEQGVDSGRVTITTNDPSCLNGTSLTNIDFSGCVPSTLTPDSNTTTVRIASNYHSPYTEQFGTSLERQLTKGTTATLTYLHSFGVHQMVTVDANAYAPLAGTTYYNSTTGPRSDPSLGIINEYATAAVFKQNQLIANVNAKITKNFNLMGFYNLSFANGNGAGGTASNSYDLNQDWGRAKFVSRHMVFLMGSYTGPWNIRFNPFLIAHTGRPYDLTTGSDATGDNYFNNRPSYADSSLCTADSTQYYQTSYGCLNVSPAEGEALVPVNLGTSPASTTFNLRLSRSFAVGPKLKAAAQGDGMNGPPPGGPPGGGRGGPGGGHGGGPGGGFGPGGFSGGGGPPRGMFDSGANARKYSLNFSAQVMNVFNIINYGTPIGTVNNTSFGKSTSLSGGPFSNGAASRRVFIQAVFSF